AAIADRLPVDDGDRVAALRRAEHHVVWPEVVMRQAFPAVVTVLEELVIARDRLADLDAIGGNARSVAFAETLPEQLDQIGLCALRRGLRFEQPWQIVHRLVVPVRGMKFR